MGISFEKVVGNKKILEARLQEREGELEVGFLIRKGRRGFSTFDQQMNMVIIIIIINIVIIIITTTK